MSKEKKKPVNRTPTKKQILKCLEDNCKKKTYSWHGEYSGNEKGETLKDAINEEAGKDRYGSGSLLAEWHRRNIEANLKCKELEEEYRPSNHYRIGIEIGNKGRIIWVDEVKAGNKKQALNPKNPKVQNMCSEFIGFKYTPVAEHINPDEIMKREKFEEIIEEREWDDNPWDCLSKNPSDKEVAEYFGIKYSILEWEIEEEEWTKEMVVAICVCGRPLKKEDFDRESEQYKYYKEDNPICCQYCNEDIRTKDEKIRDAI